MTKEKQIEEMAKALTTYERKVCERLPKDKCLLTSAIHAQVSCDYCKIAEFLYNAGYRKQKEGEWKLEHETYGKMRCSVCGTECPTERKPDPYEDYQMTDFYVTSPFCPNCGAKMKGGAGE